MGPNESAPRQTSVGPLKGQSAGAIVRAARLAAGLTLADLGRRCGYSASQVSRYERGVQPLTDITLLRRFRHSPGSSRSASGRLPSTRRLGSQVMRHLVASPRSSGLVRPVTSSPETRSRTAGRAWISSGASRSAASRALMQSARRPQVP